jgi:hypothetical protein
VVGAADARELFNQGERMDLDALDVVPGANAGHEFEVVDAQGNGLGIFLTILGRDSEEYQKRLDAVQQARIEKMFKNGQIRASGFTTPAQDRAKQCEMLAAATKSWRTVQADGSSAPTVTWRGQVYDCTFDNAKTLYAGIPPFREQAQEVVDTRANFIKA